MSFKQLKTNPHRSECFVCKDKSFVLCQCETPQTKPLSDEEIAKENLRKLNLALESQKLSDEEIWALSEEFIREKENILLFARAIEERHGIK